MTRTRRISLDKIPLNPPTDLVLCTRFGCASLTHAVYHPPEHLHVCEDAGTVVPLPPGWEQRERYQRRREHDDADTWDWLT